MRNRSAGVRSASGQALPLFAFALVALLGFAALAIDLAFLRQTRAHLQKIADASALAAAQEIPSPADVTSRAVQYAQLNDSTNGTILSDADVVLGNWDGAGTFTPGGTPTNAVRVVTRRTVATGNPAPLFFARIFGRTTQDVIASAVAVNAGEGGAFSRFIIDEDLIDSDIPSIEDLWNEHQGDLNDAGQPKYPQKEDLIKDRYLGGSGTEGQDWFIDLPPGSRLLLPTGQLGDEGMFDITHPAFPFTQSSDPSFEDFLNYNEADCGGTCPWRQNLVPKSMLDPLDGVSPVNNPALYPAYLSNPPGQCQVSPVFKSDANVAPALESGVPRIKALGERRGLLAFSIDSIGPDPDGNGSVLPFIWITVCDPVLAIPGGLASVQPGPGGNQSLRLVQ